MADGQASNVSHESMLPTPLRQSFQIMVPLLAPDQRTSYLRISPDYRPVQKGSQGSLAPRQNVGQLPQRNIVVEERRSERLKRQSHLNRSGTEMPSTISARTMFSSPILYANTTDQPRTGSGGSSGTLLSGTTINPLLNMPGPRSSGQISSNAGIHTGSPAEDSPSKDEGIRKRKLSIVNLVGSDEEDIIETPSTANAPAALEGAGQLSSGGNGLESDTEPSPFEHGHSLRPRPSLRASAKARTSLTSPIQRRPRANGSSHRKRVKTTASFKDLVWSDMPGELSDNPMSFGTPAASCNKLVLSGTSKASSSPCLTSRQEIRLAIATETAAKRAKFFMAKKDYFLPLLPETNYIRNLLDAVRPAQSNTIESPIVGDKLHPPLKTVRENISPYIELDQQPKGVKATMKPYQLAGLSYLLYLYRNGLSGILGDEMGLGKTLQTLSLIQHLKEHDKPAAQGAESRPFLVVCPLSVLSSWLIEARRWTPNLKVIRFHGTAKERARLKKKVGHVQARSGKTSSQPKWPIEMTSPKGIPIVKLDADSENESRLPATVDIVLTTYETFQIEQSWFKRAFVWRYVILDEGHKIKNDQSQISLALQGLHAEFRLILTGTPLQNNLGELWALLHWLYPEVFDHRTNERFRIAFDIANGRVNTSFMDDARRLLELIMLRRMKNGPSVNINLPPKHEVLLFVPMTPMQRFWYTRLLTRTDQGLLDELFQGAKEKELKAMSEEKEQDQLMAEAEAEERALQVSLPGAQSTADAQKIKPSAHAEMKPETEDDWAETKAIMKRAVEMETQDRSKLTAWRKLMNLLMQLRKCCNHPYTLPHAQPDPYVEGDHLIRASGKFIVLEKLVSELVLKQKEKVLFFSGFTVMLDLCEELLGMISDHGVKFKFVRLDGGTARANRSLAIRLFNTKPEYQVMLISTRAGGLGLNLASASKVVMLDQDWNPQVSLQAESRAHRIGQTKPVTVYKLCTQGTVEAQMIGRIQKKLYLSAKVTEAMGDTYQDAPPSPWKRGRESLAENHMPQLATSELMSLVRRGAQTLAHPEIDVNEMLNWDWETTLDKCKESSTPHGIGKESTPDPDRTKDEEERWLASMERVQSYVLDGKKYARQKAKEAAYEIEPELSREARRVGKNVTVMIDGFAVSKASLKCKDWEAIPTLSGNNRLDEPRRSKRVVVEHQNHCQVCWQGDELVCCGGCPRSYHYDCLDQTSQQRTKAMTFYCGQHQCCECGEKTQNAGGLILRCRWCHRGYCDDCLDWERTELISETLPEFETLGFGDVSQAYYIGCPGCSKQQRDHPEVAAFCARMSAQFDRQLLEAKSVTQAEGISIPPAERSSRTASMTEATTADGSGPATPIMAPENHQSPGKGEQAF